MNSIDRDRKFQEAREALEHTIRTSMHSLKGDPLAFTFVMVHVTSPALYRELLENGGKATGDGFALSVGDRSTLPGEPMSGIPDDQIACMISIDGRHKALGLPLDILGTVAGGEA